MRLINTETVLTVQITDHERDLIQAALRIAERYYLRKLDEESDARSQDQPKPDLAKMYANLRTQL